MGKKRIVKKVETEELKVRPKESGGERKRVERGLLHVLSTYNNTILTLTDAQGNALFTSSSGALGFKGAKKGTPFAAAKVGETVGDKAQALGIKEVGVIVNGVGSGRESSLRGFISRGGNLSFIRDKTPVPHNGPRPRKPRRV